MSTFALNDDFDAALAEAYASANINQVILYAMEIQHPAFTEPARVVQWPVLDNGLKEFKLKLEDDAVYDPGKVVTFVGVPFEILLPKSSLTTMGSFQFSVSAVSMELSANLRAAAMDGTPIQMVYREYIEGEELIGPRRVQGNIILKSPKSESNKVVADGAVLGWLLRKYGEIYTPSGYPGLVRGR